MLTPRVAPDEAAHYDCGERGELTWKSASFNCASRTSRRRLDGRRRRRRRSPGWPAQGADSVTVEVGECVNLQSPEERFACYERQVDAARTARAPLRRASNTAASDSVTDARPARGGNAAPRRQRRAEATEPQEFVATVTGVRRDRAEQLRDHARQRSGLAPDVRRMVSAAAGAEGQDPPVEVGRHVLAYRRRSERLHSSRRECAELP